MVVEGWPPDKDRNMLNYISNKNHLMKCARNSKKVFANIRLLILVKSAAGFYNRRYTNRLTWNIFALNHPGIMVLNVVGKTDSSNVTERVRAEAAKHCDMLQVDMQEGYLNNTLKVRLE